MTIRRKQTRFQSTYEGLPETSSVPLEVSVAEVGVTGGAVGVSVTGGAEGERSPEN